jgi:hypothetical protein
MELCWDRLKSGDFILIYSVKLADIKDPLVLGYEKDAPTKGGLVLMTDGKVVALTAAEFKKAKLAK